MGDGSGLISNSNTLRIGVLGAAGQLGRSLVRQIDAADDLELAFAATRDQIDLSDFDQIDPWLESLTSALPELVINAAAFTKVDSCETEKERAYRMNALAPAEWARRCLQRNIQFFHVSTDYVFPGDGSRPYREEDPTDPKTAYGSSKRAGEVAVLGTDPNALVVRTSWVFGPGRNFVMAILDQASRRRSGELEGPLKVVDDQHGAPTYSGDLAEALLLLGRISHSAGDHPCGLLHLTNTGATTWFGFARAILDQAGYSDIVIDPVATSSFDTAAWRSAYSLLCTDRAIAAGVIMRDWKEALAAYLQSSDVPENLLSDVFSEDARGSSEDQGVTGPNGNGMKSATRSEAAQ
jgi:dTDP-4-dehydrorhamnose reductase